MPRRPLPLLRPLSRAAGLSVLLVACALCLAPAARAQSAADTTGPLSEQQRNELASAGAKLAEERCQKCHAIDATSTSLNKDAPPFRDLVGKWPAEDLEEALAEGIVTGHEEMPEFVFTTDEITAFIEFLHGLGSKN
jgi:mono/diheme cytochrome c family protein